MDFDTLKYNGKVLWGAVTATVFCTSFVVGNFLRTEHREELREIKTEHHLNLIEIEHEADKIKSQELIEQRFNFLQNSTNNLNGRLDRKTNSNLDYFKQELNRVDTDQATQWDMINKNHAK